MLLCINILFDAYSCAAACDQPHGRCGLKALAKRRVATRVAVAGATGYTGQELLRLLSRHPGGHASPPRPRRARRPRRRLPALGPHLERHDHAARSPKPDALAREADVVFLALPDKAAAELAPALVDAGVRVIDLSGAFRLRSEDARGTVVSGNAPHARTVSSTGSPNCSGGAVAGARMVANPGCYPTATLLALAPIASAGLLAAGADIDRRREVGRLRRRQDAVRAHALLGSPRQPRRLRRVRAPSRRRNRAGGRRRARRGRRRTRGEFRAAPGAARPRHSLDDLLPRGAGHHRGRAGGRLRARVRRRDVRPARRRRRCPKSSTSRTPTSATSAGASMRPAAWCSCRSSTTCSRARRARPCRT